jgi:hypothetical protein
MDIAPASIAPVGVVTTTQPSSLQISGTNQVVLEPAITTTVINSGTAAFTDATAMSMMEPTTLPVSSVVAIGDPPENELMPSLPPPSASTPGSVLSSIELLSLLLFSPLGYFAIGALIIVSFLSLWVAYLLGQRGRPEQHLNKPSASEDFLLQPTSEVSAPKT